MTVQQIRKIARALFRNKSKSAFEVRAKVGRARKTLLCKSVSERGAKQIARKYYREMYPEKPIVIESATRF